MSMSAEASLIALSRIWHTLEPQAQDVLLDIARRLRAGQAEYGRMDVHKDPRDFLDEAAEEAMDIVVYAAMNRRREEKP